MLKKIMIKFVDFWDEFDPYDNFIIKILRKRFEVEIIEDENRNHEVQYLFYSCMGYENLQYTCIKIFYTGENFVPDFNLCDYAIGFENLSYSDRYIRYPLYLVNYFEDYRDMIDKNERNLEIRKKFCSFVVSQSAVANPIREEFFLELSKYKKVDSGGRFLNNIGEPEGVKNKKEFQKQYKFSIAFENTSQPGYCTEKIVQAFAAGTVPIYWGDPNIKEYFNEKAFINCMDYSSIDEAIKKIIEIDNDDGLYLAMLKEEAIIDKKQLLDNYELKLEEWLYSIFNQDINKAKRINLYGKQLLYRQEEIFEKFLLEKYGRIEKEESKTFIKKIKRKMRLLKR